MIEGIQDTNEEEITTPEVETPEAEIAEPQAGEGEPGSEDPGAEPEAYVPDFNYKYKDEEFQFDERLQGLVKTKDDEQFVRDLVTAQKAIGEYKEVGGIREIQEKLGNYERFETGFKDHETLNNEINQLSGMLAQDNTAGFEAFRKHLGISKEQVMKWATEEAQGMQDPAVMQQIEAQRQMHEQNFNLQYQNNQMHNIQEQQIVQQRTVELDTMLGSNDVAQKFDTLVGTPGSFKQEVMNHGTSVYNQSGGKTILSVAEAVMAVQSKYQGLVANQNSGTNEQVAPTPTQQVKSDPQRTVVVRQENKQVIPNLGGGQGSPAKQKITNLAQMRAAAKAMD